MVKSTFDRLREQLALPTSTHPVEPNYPAPTAAGSRVFFPALDDARGPVDANEKELSSEDRELGRNQRLSSRPFIPEPPDAPAPVLHPHAQRAGCLSHKSAGHGRPGSGPAPHGLDNYHERASGFDLPGFIASCAGGTGGNFGMASDWLRQEPSPYDEWRGSAFDMEQQLEMVAWSLRGDQDEVAGVRKGLMMLQPFENDSELERGPCSHTPRSSTEPAFSPRMVLRQSSNDLSTSPPVTQHLSPCPTDYMYQITLIENSVLKPEQANSSWISGQAITAVCIAPWSAQTNGQLSLDLHDTLDMSFFDVANMSHDWWFAIKADKQQIDHNTHSAPRIWRFPQDFGLLRKQSGYFPSKCVRLISAPQAGNSNNGNMQKGEMSSTTRISNATPVPAAETFPILQPDPASDPPLIPFADVPLWLPTWTSILDGISPRDDTEGEFTRASGSLERSTLGAISDSATVSSMARVHTTQFSDQTNDIGLHDTRSATENMIKVNASSLQGSHSSRTSSPQIMNSQKDTPIVSLMSPQKLSAIENSDYAFTTVRILRNPNAPPNTPAGIGLQFARPRGEMGPCHVLALRKEGTAFKSGKVSLGDLIHEVSGRNIYDLSPEEITGLILGQPSTYVTLTLSESNNRQHQSKGIHEDGVGRSETTRTISPALYSRIRNGDVPALEEDLKCGALHVNSLIEHKTKWCSLHYAAADGYWRFADLLLDYGADPHVQTAAGATAADIARANGHHDLADHLCRRAVKMNHTSLEEASKSSINVATTSPHQSRSHPTAAPLTPGRKAFVHASGTIGQFYHKALRNFPSSSTRKTDAFEPRQEPPASPKSASQHCIREDLNSSPSRRTVTMLRASKVSLFDSSGPTGIGIQFERQSNQDSGPCVICALMPKGPAARSGEIFVGDLLHMVDGTDVTNLSIPQIGQKILGPPSTAVTLTVSTIHAASLCPSNSSPNTVANQTPVSRHVDGDSGYLCGNPARNLPQESLGEEHARGNGAVVSVIPVDEELSSFDLQAQPQERKSKSPESRHEGLGSPQYTASGTGMIVENGGIPRMPPLESMPSQWEERQDPRSGRKYYVNHMTMTTSWNPPPLHSFPISHHPAPKPTKKKFSMFGMGLAARTPSPMYTPPPV